jgi:hypothetical protein
MVGWKARPIAGKSVDICWKLCVTWLLRSRKRTYAGLRTPIYLQGTSGEKRLTAAHGSSTYPSIFSYSTFSTWQAVLSVPTLPRSPSCDLRATFDAEAIRSVAPCVFGILSPAIPPSQVHIVCHVHGHGCVRSRMELTYWRFTAPLSGAGDRLRRPFKRCASSNLYWWLGWKDTASSMDFDSMPSHVSKYIHAGNVVRMYWCLCRASPLLESARHIKVVRSASIHIENDASGKLQDAMDMGVNIHAQI